MNIREARIEDLHHIRLLLIQLGYTKETKLLQANLSKMLSDNSYKVLVYELDGKVVAFMTILYYLQIAFEGETANIGFFVVDSAVRGKGVGKEMEEYCTQIAIERNCSLIELYSEEKRVNAHRFYERQGYKSYEKFFVKEINENI